MAVVADRIPRTTSRASMPRTAAPVLGIALAALATLVWSGSFVTSRALGDSVPPVQQAFWRWIVALATVALFGARQAWRQRALILRHLGYVLLAALLGVTVCNTLVKSPQRHDCPQLRGFDGTTAGWALLAAAAQIGRPWLYVPRGAGNCAIRPHRRCGRTTARSSCAGTEP